MSTTLLVAAAFFVLAEIADCVTTEIGMQRGLIEGNPVARALFGKHVVLGSVAVAVAFLAFCLWGGQHSPVGAQIALWFVGAGHAVAAALNTITIRRHE